MELKLACADFTFPLLSQDKILKLISLIGFEGIDIGLFEGRSHLQPVAIFERLNENAGELGKKLRDQNLCVADIFLQAANDFSSKAINHPDNGVRKVVRELFLKTLEFTSLCNGKHVSCLPGVVFEEEPEGMSYDRCCEELSWRCERAKEFGIIFSVEPHLGSIIPNPKTAQKMVDNVKGLSLTLDYGHFTKVGISDSEIEPLIQSASHFHARGAAKGLLQASFKNSTIDYSRVLEIMNSTNYQGYIGIEYVWVDWEHCNEVDNLSEVILLKDFFTAEFKKLKTTSSENQ